MGVDLVLDQELLGLTAADIGLRLVVSGDQVDLAAENAARCVDAVDRHLDPDEGGLAARGSDTRERLGAADLVRL